MTRPCLPALLLFAAAAACSETAAAQVCDLTLTACPSQLPKGVLAVPPEVISLDARIPYCQEAGKITSTAAPSIMFVIDHSGSMDNTDPDNARFTVVTTLLDSIFASTPRARVGLSIFHHRLAYDYRDNAFFKPLWPGDTEAHDSYAPLTALDTVFAGGRRGVDTLKALLRLDADGKLVHHTKRAKEREPTDGGGGPGGRAGTDITLGFEAALEAFKTSQSPKEARFIIFLSDGEPSVEDEEREEFADEYEKGLATPTTYTVFFNPRSNTPPQTLRTMTENIRANGYSTSNPNSAIHNINLPGSELQNILQKSVLAQILTVPTTGKSVSVAISGGATLTTSVKPDSGHFLLSSRMPLNADQTAFQMSYAHSFRDTTKVPPVLRDTLIAYGFTVQRVPGAPLPANTVKTCRDQADLALYSGGQPVTAVQSGQGLLEARLTPPAGQSCAPCTVQVRPSLGADRETLGLSAAGTSMNGSFTRQESQTPVPGDGRLQHTAADSIVLIWVNPENALDVVRRSYPFQALPSTLALFSKGVAVEEVTADDGALEVRLTRPAGTACAGCAVQVSASGGPDKENVALAPQGGAFRGTFIRLESAAPIAGDGKLQHVATDSIVLTWVNPDNPQERIRRSYPYRSIPPELALFSGGKALDTVTSAHDLLEIRLTLPSGEPCEACGVQVSLALGADKENVAMSGAASPYRGTIAREVSLLPAAGNGKLEHPASDSIVVVYVNPRNPSQRVRRAWLYINFENTVGLIPHNDVARVDDAGPLPADRIPWVLSEAPGLAVQMHPGGGACCKVLGTPLGTANPDSARLVGLIIEASREFNLELFVYSNLGQYVNRVAFTVPKSEFPKLSPMPGKDTRFFRILWNGLTAEGARAGTGAYILRASVTLLPIPGITRSPAPATLTRTVGILRSPFP